MTEGEIAVTSKEELPARRSEANGYWHCGMHCPMSKSAKRSGSRALIEELWSAIEALPDPEPEADAKRPSKQVEVIAMLSRPEGVTVDEVASAMGWQRHTVRVGSL